MYEREEALKKYSNEELNESITFTEMLKQAAADDFERHQLMLDRLLRERFYRFGEQDGIVY